MTPRRPGHRLSVGLPVVCCMLLLLFEPLPAAAQARPQAPQTIYGRLIDDATRQPIAQAAVHLVDASGRRVQTVLSDSAGRFRFAPFAEGEYTLRAERIGYRTGESKAFRVLAGESISFDFYLSTRAVLLAPIEVKASTRAWAERYVSAELLPFLRDSRTRAAVRRVAASDWTGRARVGYYRSVFQGSGGREKWNG